MPKTDAEVAQDETYQAFWDRFANNKKYIAFDLDGTLARHEPRESTDHVGEPIPSMVELARSYLLSGRHVRVITARVAPVYDDAAEQVTLVKEWLAKHVTHDMPYEIQVQAHKCGRMELLYDDRAIQVVRNTGERPAEELEDAYSQIFWAVPQAHDENGDAMTLRKKIDVLMDGQDRLWSIGEHDQRHGIEGDAYATFQTTVTDEHPILVDPNTPSDTGFFVSVREARCLAASLLRAADEAEKAGKT